MNKLMQHQQVTSSPEKHVSPSNSLSVHNYGKHNFNIQQSPEILSSNSNVST
jgi:hypothetical protein